MGKLIIPKTYVKNVNNPLIFLAGPIISAPNWQDEAIDFLLSKKQDLVVASPRRGVRKRISQYIVKGEENFPRQRAWERHYLDLAAKTGAIIFWLPGEEEHNCEKVYGAMTRLELGQWMTRYHYNPSLRLCIGSDGKFSELHTISYDLGIDMPDKRIFPTLEETCIEALNLVKSE